MSADDYDVIVVGCGPVGMVLSALLANAGVRVLALEREDEIGFRPRARHIDGEAMRVLQSIGVADAGAEIMSPMQGALRLVGADGGTLLEQRFDQTQRGRQGWFEDYQLYQPLLLGLLREHLDRSATARLRTSCEVTGVTQNSERVSVEIRRGETGMSERVTAAYVVGCDGANSFVRREIGASLHALGPDHPFLVIDAFPMRAEYESPDLQVSMIVCDPARPHYASPGHGMTVPIRFEFMVMPGEDGEELTKPAALAGLTQPYLDADEVHFERAAVYVFHSLLLDQWRVGRVLLAGDAAHVQPPFMGQGLCSGFRDASNLAWKLAMVCRGETDDGLLDSYQSERSPHARDWINEANRIGAIVMTTNAAEARARDKRIRSGESRELRPLQPRLGPGLHGDDPEPAGTLAPQPSLPDGRRLDDLLGPRFAVITTDDLWRGVAAPLREAVEAAPHVVVVNEGVSAATELLAHYDSAAVILRPDRYVLGIAGDASALEGLLGRIPAISAAPAGAGLTH